MDLDLIDDWVPAACTLPTAVRPLRVAEFDRFFSDYATSVTRVNGGGLSVGLRPHPEAASVAARLAVRETDCCSFFRFDLAVAEGTVALTISSGPENAAVLAALGDRIGAALEGSR